MTDDHWSQRVETPISGTSAETLIDTGASSNYMSHLFSIN
jgi:hypothetical protein